jgi:hypothetical protein
MCLDVAVRPCGKKPNRSVVEWSHSARGGEGWQLNDTGLGLEVGAVWSVDARPVYNLDPHPKP